VNVFKQIFLIQWRATLPVFAMLAVAAFALPLMSVQGVDPSGDPAGYAYRILAIERMWLPAFPLLAMTTGALLGVFVWSWDHRFNHVYALSLPLSRARYALLKMGAGALLLLGPALALGAGGFVATQAIDIPAPLQSYPGSLAIRFALTSALCYALFFALASSSIRLVVKGAIALLLVLALSGPAVSLLSATVAPEMMMVNVPRVLVRMLMVWPGPFSILAGNWMLFDV